MISGQTGGRFIDFKMLHTSLEFISDFKLIALQVLFLSFRVWQQLQFSSQAAEKQMMNWPYLMGKPPMLEKDGTVSRLLSVFAFPISTALVKLEFCQQFMIF